MHKLCSVPVPVVLVRIAASYILCAGGEKRQRNEKVNQATGSISTELQTKHTAALGLIVPISTGSRGPLPVN